MPSSAARLLELLALRPDEQDFSALEAGKRIAAGVVLPPPVPVFPRYVEPEAKA
jgi:methionyl-tRNA synthetase